MALSSLTRTWIKTFIFIAALVPLAVLIRDYANNDLSANPLLDVTHETGVWALRFLVLTLAVTPLRRITGIVEVSRYRRMLGLFAFFYGTLHFTTYIWFDKFFAWDEILRDIPKRPFILAGFTAFVLMIPLALTSTKGSIRRMGGKRWNLLHRLVYVSAIAAAIHYIWLVKVVTAPQIIYASLVAGLLAIRAVYTLRQTRRRTANAPQRVHAQTANDHP